MGRSCNFGQLTSIWDWTFKILAGERGQESQISSLDSVPRAVRASPQVGDRKLFSSAPGKSHCSPATHKSFETCQG